MAKDINTVKIECLRLMLRPVVRYCLKRVLTIQDVLESVKVVFIEMGAEDMLEKGQKVNVSRLSVATGMHRRDVMRIFREGETKESSISLLSRVMGQWAQDKRFTTKAGKPRVLTMEGDDCEFNRLVRRISTDVHPGTVLFELQRIGAVEKTRYGLKLHHRAHLLHENPEEGFKLLARDTEDLVLAVEQNVLEKQRTKNLHARTEFDNVYVKDLPKIKKWIIDEGTAFHDKLRKHLAKFDKDMNPNPKKEGGGTVVVGTFCRVPPVVND